MQLSLKKLRAEGFEVEIGERFDFYSKRRKDLFGFGDILAAKEGYGMVLVQTTSGSNMAARRTKILGLPGAHKWLAAGGRIVLHGWCKRKLKRGGTAFRYVAREEEIKSSEISQ